MLVMIRAMGNSQVGVPFLTVKDPRNTGRLFSEDRKPLQDCKGSYGFCSKLVASKCPEGSLLVSISCKEVSPRPSLFGRTFPLEPPP